LSSSLLRSLILAGLGCAALIACGRSLATDFDDIDSGELDGSGGNAGSVSMTQGGAAGSNPAGGSGGSAMVGNGGSSLGGRGGMAGRGGTGGQAGATMMPDPILTWPCEDPVPLGNGFVGCESGMVHRPRTGNLSCVSQLPRAEALDASDYAAIEQAAQERGLSLAQILALMPCISDTDCEDAPNGHCEVSNLDFTGVLTSCEYGCVRDADCGSGSICSCGSPVGTCVAASCRRDSDCGAVLCTSHTLFSGCGSSGDSIAFACQTFQDACGGDGDCGAAEPYCALVGGRRDCTGATGCF
jgi:hypothetical protein